jgi:hypothetical protein
MFATFFAVVIAVLLLAGTVLAYELGRRLGRRWLVNVPTGPGTSVIDGAVFSLLGLLIAFTFSGAVTRFDGRKQLIVDEANAIGTAWMRLDLLPADAQRALRADFRRYVDVRLETYQNLTDFESARAGLGRSKAIQDEIWQRAVVAARDTQPPATILVLPPLNAMFDVASTHMWRLQMHPPLTIFVMLGMVLLIASLLAGHGAAATKQSWVHVIGFAATLTAVVYVILDMEYPRVGLIRPEELDRALVEVRAGMN